MELGLGTKGRVVIAVFFFKLTHRGCCRQSN